MVTTAYSPHGQLSNPLSNTGAVTQNPVLVHACIRCRNLTTGGTPPNIGTLLQEKESSVNISIYLSIHLVCVILAVHRNYVNTLLYNSLSQSASLFLPWTACHGFKWVTQKFNQVRLKDTKLDAEITSACDV